MASLRAASVQRCLVGTALSHRQAPAAFTVSRPLLHPQPQSSQLRWLARSRSVLCAPCTAAPVAAVTEQKAQKKQKPAKAPQQQQQQGEKARPFTVARAHVPPRWACDNFNLRSQPTAAS